MTVYGHPVTYGTMGTVFAAVIAAFLSKVVLQEMNRLIDSWGIQASKVFSKYFLHLKQVPMTFYLNHNQSTFGFFTLICIKASTFIALLFFNFILSIRTDVESEKWNSYFDLSGRKSEA